MTPIQWIGHDILLGVTQGGWVRHHMIVYLGWVGGRTHAPPPPGHPGLQH